MRSHRSGAAGPAPAGGAAGAAGSGAGSHSDPLAPLLELDGVRDGVAGARESMDRLLAHRVLRRRSSAVSAESALRGARASAALDGADVPLALLRSGRDIGPVGQAALRISAELGTLVGVWERAPLQVLARLHVLAAAGVVPADRLGRPSGGPEASARLRALAGIVAGGTRAPAVVVAAVVHGEIRALAPFGWGDALVARAAARLTLVSRGLDPKGVGVPEVGHLELLADYDATLDRYVSATAEGIAGWVRHCCQAVELGAREGLAICEAVLRG